MKISALKVISSFLVTILCFAVLPESTVTAEPTVLKWTQIITPGAIPSRNEIVSPCEVNRIAIGSDGKTFYAVDIPNADKSTGAKALYKSINGGASWCDDISRTLYQTMDTAERTNFRVWDIAIAPDNPELVAVITSNASDDAPKNVWITTDGGGQWINTYFPSPEQIRAIDISPNYGGNYDISVGTCQGDGSGTVWVLQSSVPYNWKNQVSSGNLGDVLTLKFSPSYSMDHTLVAVYSTTAGTFINTGIRDIDTNSTDWSTLYSGSPPEITTGTPGSSPKSNQIIGADLELPKDFSGQSGSLRRYYVSVDDGGITGTAGIYRFDDRTGYLLLRATLTKRISSIAYYGGFASGKLLAGEVLGNRTSATVMTWFTDSPTTCPSPCWYQAMKPPTGAAGNNINGYANTQIAWSPDGTVAYASTASSAPLLAGAQWYIPLKTGFGLDESAFSLSLNNGETWNQLSLIDTRIDQFVDIAPSPDCSVLYLASVNREPSYSGFDSVWRSQNATGASTWERVLCHLAAEDNTQDCILQLAGDHYDGQVVFWAARNTKNAMWSADFGDFWNTVAPSIVVQDIAADGSQTLFVLDSQGYVEKLVWEGKGWISQCTVSTGLDSGYSISTAYTGVTPDNLKGQVFVGGKGTGRCDVAYSEDGGLSFTLIETPLPTRGDTMVIATQNYDTERGASGDIIAINPGGMYQWSTSYGGGSWAWPSPTPNEWAPQWGGPSWPTPVTALSISRNGSFYFTDTWGTYIRWNYASAGLNIFLNYGSEPSRKLKICGGLELDQPVTVWLVDQQPYSPPYGGVWFYTDTLLWSGPVPIKPVSLTEMNCDPVSGRNPEINLSWKPLSLSLGYRIEIAKDEDFALKVADIGNTWGGRTSSLSRTSGSDPHTPYVPYDSDSPALVIPPGGGMITDGNGNTWTLPELEAGHIYYWRVTVQSVATGDYITSPSSWRETFVISPGYRVAARYVNPEPLAPKNGSADCPTKGIAFAWSQLPNATKYEFVLAEDRNLKDVVFTVVTSSTACIYENGLEPGKIYFWRVRALEPVPSEWSFISVFRTKLALPSQTTHVAPSAPPISWLWVIGVLVWIGLLTLVIHTRR